MVGAGGLNSDATWGRCPSSPPELTGFACSLCLCQILATAVHPRCADHDRGHDRGAYRAYQKNDELTQAQRRSSKLGRVDGFNQV